MPGRANRSRRNRSDSLPAPALPARCLAGDPAPRHRTAAASRYRNRPAQHRRSVREGLLQQLRQRPQDGQELQRQELLPPLPVQRGLKTHSQPGLASQRQLALSSPRTGPDREADIPTTSAPHPSRAASRPAGRCRLPTDDCRRPRARRSKSALPASPR